jgi:Ca2+:H+ antiporter
MGLRPESATTNRDDGYGSREGFAQPVGLGLSESMHSADTIRRRSELASPGGYGLSPPSSQKTPSSPLAPLISAPYSPPILGTIYSPSITESTAAPRERQHSRSATAGSQAGRSPALGPQPRQPKATRSKPPNPRRQSSSQAPHRGGIYSVDDDPREVEADAAEQQRRREQLPTARRGPSGPGTLSRLQSFRNDPAEAEEESNDDSGADEVGPAGPVPESGQIDGQSGAPAEDDLLVNEDAEVEDEEGAQSADVEDDDGDVSDAESFTLKDRQQAINATHPFGIRLWKPALYKKDRSVQKTAEGDIHSSPGGQVSTTLLIFNLVWTLLFGWWMALITAIGALTCVLFAAAPSGREYGRVLWGLAGYLFYPFGKFVRLEQDEAYLHEDRGEGRSISEYEQWQSGDLENGRLFFGPYEHSRSIIGRSRRSIDSEPSETDSLLQRSRVLDGDGDPDQEDEEERIHKRRLFGRGEWNIGRVIFFVFFYSLIAPSLIIVSGACWLLVFWIPMAKVTMLLFSHLRRHPLALSFESDVLASRDADAPYSSILLCTYRAVGSKYWKYTVDGTNIFLINLLAVVGFVVFDYLVLDGILHVDNVVTSPAFLFVSGLLSIIPLAYFIGQAVASISAQSSMGLGAAINAFFSTIVEVFLYCVALSQGKAQLVEGSIVGSIFAGILFLPGLSMCFGAIKRKTQRFNAKSAGVTSTMLLFAVLSAFSPTLFYQIYGTHEIKCQDCVDVTFDAGDCRRCFYTQMPALDDRFYLSAVRPFCYMNAIMLFLAYVIGLWFTLRTHAAVIWNVEPEEKKQDDHATLQHASSSQRPSQQHQHPHHHHHSAAESSAVDVRDSQMYKRILGHSLKQVGLQPNPDDLAASLHGSIATAPVQHSTSNGTLHVVPPKMMHTVSIPGLSEADNQQLVRDVAEMAATAATYAARDSVRRRTSGVPSSSAAAAAAAAAAASRPAAPARLATYDEVGTAAIDAAGAGHGGHDAPNWSRRKSAIILLGATVLYAIIAEILVDTVDVVLEGFSIDEKFLGITLFALVPNTTEFLNAISFAMNGNIALSMEIGSAYALQVCLLQIPALVLFSAYYVIPPPTGSLPTDPSAYTFSLLFPQWDMVCVILCVFLLSYMYGEGKSNYFKGSILLLSYFVVVAGFFFSGFASDEMGMRRFDVMRNGEWMVTGAAIRGGPAAAPGPVST